MLSPPHVSRRASMAPREPLRAQFQKEQPSIYKYKKLHHTNTAIHGNGTAKQAEDRVRTPGTSQAVCGNSELLTRTLGAASTLPQHPTVRSMAASSRPQPVPSSARSPAEIRGRENGLVDRIDLAEMGSTCWELYAYCSHRVDPISAKYNRPPTKSPKITIDVKQTLRGVQRSRARLERRQSSASTARQGLLARSSRPTAPRQNRGPLLSAKIDQIRREPKSIRARREQ